MANSLAWFLYNKGKTSLRSKIKPKVTFITSSMNLGGAERQLLLLCNELMHEVEIEIISLDASGPLLPKYKTAWPDLKVVDSRKLNPFFVLLGLRKLIKISRPDVVVTWLYRADLLGGLASRLAANTPVIWSARNSSIPNLGPIKKTILRSFSHVIPKIVVANGFPALNFHVSIGYQDKKLRRIPNLVSPWTQNVKSQSKLLGDVVGEDELRIGLAARQVPGKGILETIHSVLERRNQMPRIELSLIGQETEIAKEWRDSNLYCGYSVEQISSDIDLSSWFSSLDLYLMPSTMWESQPNALIEAISIGCPVLVSNTISLEIDIPEVSKFSILETEWLDKAIHQMTKLSSEERQKNAEDLREQVYNLYAPSSIRTLWLQAICEVKI